MGPLLVMHYYGALKGRLPVKLRCLFKIQLPDTGALYLAFVDLTVAVNSDASQLCRVENPTNRTGNAIQNKVIAVSSLDDVAHLVPTIPGCSSQENKSWWVNSHIDLEMWNIVWN